MHNHQQSILVSKKKQGGERRAHHERLKVGSPPLRQAISDLPLVVNAMGRVELARIDGRREAVVESALEPLDLVFAWLQIVARSIGPRSAYKKGREEGGGIEETKADAQFEERVGNLEHEDVRVSMVMHDEDPLDGAAHTKVFIVILQPLQTRGDGWVFLRLRFLGAVEKGKKRIKSMCV